jgi:FAD synthase
VARPSQTPGTTAARGELATSMVTLLGLRHALGADRGWRDREATPRPAPSADASRCSRRRSVAGSRRAVLALGNFDGVHLGHRALLDLAAPARGARNAPLVVVSFFPPAKVLFGDARFLASEAEKHALLAEAGADEVVIVPFTRAFAATPPEAFVAELAALVAADDRGRRGLPLRSRAQRRPRPAARRADHLEVVPLELVGDEVVKSSAVRAALADRRRRAGEPTCWARRTGSTAGRPRRPARPDDRLPHRSTSPPTRARRSPIGVFAVRVDTPLGRFGGMANVGPRPTFPDGAPGARGPPVRRRRRPLRARVTVHLLAPAGAAALRRGRRPARAARRGTRRPPGPRLGRARRVDSPHADLRTPRRRRPRCARARSCASSSAQRHRARRARRSSPPPRAPPSVPLEEVPRIELDQAVRSTHHQGVVAEVAELGYADPEAPFELARARGERLLLVCLDHVTDPRNYGAIIRSAEALGAHGVVSEARRSAPLSPWWRRPPPAPPPTCRCCR